MIIFKGVKRINQEQLFLMAVIAINFTIKAITASLIDLGNDEVYYWTYALYPDWSHFDHPPMVGLVIQLFSLNLYFHSELFIRLGSLVLSSGSIYLLFYLVKKIYSSRADYFSVFLFTAYLYFNIISGLFILPDTPLIFFSLLALYFGIPAIMAHEPSKEDSRRLLLFGFFTGMALLSKYSAVFLWFGFVLFIILQKRIWLKKTSLYLSILLSLILMAPVFFWNLNNHFISFSFHASRVGINHAVLNYSSFLDFNFGQIFYQNPVLFIVFVLTIVSLFRAGIKALSPMSLLLLCLSLPLILLSVCFSVFMNVFPHWSGPAFISLLILSSDWLNKLYEHNALKAKGVIMGANLLFFMVILLAFLQIDLGLLYSSPREDRINKTGEHDPSLDMYGWKQTEVKFRQFLDKEGINEQDYKNVKILSNKWFPAAHLDFYVAQPLHIELLVTGKLWDAHKYYWINQNRNLAPGNKMFYITSSQDYYDPEELSLKFSTIIPRDTIRIMRNKENVKDLFIYEMRNPSGDISLITKKSSGNHVFR